MGTMINYLPMKIISFEAEMGTNDIVFVHEREIGVDYPVWNDDERSVEYISLKENEGNDE